MASTIAPGATAAAEIYGESFGIPSSILDVAMWDHDMLLMWADAVALSDSSVRRLDAASELTGKDLAEPKAAQQILESILDEGDLQTALEELEALRVLMHLQPGTRVLHHNSSSCDDAATTNGDAANRGLGGGCVGNDGDDDGSSLPPMSFAVAEVWLSKLHDEMQELHSTANTIAASNGRGALSSWGEDWERPHAPPIAVVASSAAAPDAMGSDVDDDDDSADGATTSATVIASAASASRRLPAAADNDDAASSNGSFSSVDMGSNAAALPRASTTTGAYCVAPLGRKWHHPDDTADDEFQ